MRITTPRTSLVLAAFALLFTVAPVRADDITTEVVDRFLKALNTEQAERDKVGPELKAVDDKLAKFRDCASTWKAAGDVSGSKLGGLAAKAAMKSKCGATGENGFHEEREKIERRPLEAALKAGGFKDRDYAHLKERIIAFLGGNKGGFKPAELSALDARKSELEKALGSQMTVAANDDDDAPRRGGRRGGRRPPTWTMDRSWEVIGEIYGLLYSSGATMLEKAYQPGQWTRWQVSESCNQDERTVLERAFLAKQADGGEWWRVKWVQVYKDTDDQGKEVERSDTTIIEQLVRPQGEWIRQLVRVRAKMPGQAEAAEMMVPQAMSMLSMAAFGLTPTAESIEGATVGTDKLTTPAGTFTARHVRFGGSSGGTVDWWLSDAAPGGLVRFSATEETDDDTCKDKKDVSMTELIAHGTGAKSELGIVIK